MAIPRKVRRDVAVVALIYKQLDLFPRRLNLLVQGL
jgi:hypothetical protein